MMRLLGIICISILLTSCESTREDKVESVMQEYMLAVNKSNIDDLLDLVYPPMFEVVPKREIAYDFNGGYYHGWGRRKIKIKKLNKVYGPYEKDGVSYVLADFEFKKTRIFYRRKYSAPYIFVSEDDDKWYIIPYSLNYNFYHNDFYDLISYRFRYNSEDEYTMKDIVPESVLEQMFNDYIPGSEN